MYQTKLAKINSVNILLLFLNQIIIINIANFLPRFHLKSTVDDICFNSDDILKVIHAWHE